MFNLVTLVYSARVFVISMGLLEHGIIQITVSSCIKIFLTCVTCQHKLPVVTRPSYKITVYYMYSRTTLISVRNSAVYWTTGNTALFKADGRVSANQFMYGGRQPPRAPGFMCRRFLLHTPCRYSTCVCLCVCGLQCQRQSIDLGPVNPPAAPCF